MTYHIGAAKAHLRINSTVETANEALTAIEVLRAKGFVNIDIYGGDAGVLDEASLQQHALHEKMTFRETTRLD